MAADFILEQFVHHVLRGDIPLGRQLIVDAMNTSIERNIGTSIDSSNIVGSLVGARVNGTQLAR